jgi:hypothetical protein
MGVIDQLNSSGITTGKVSQLPPSIDGRVDLSNISSLNSTSGDAAKVSTPTPVNTPTDLSGLKNLTWDGNKPTPTAPAPAPTSPPPATSTAPSPTSVTAANGINAALQLLAAPAVIQDVASAIANLASLPTQLDNLKAAQNNGNSIADQIGRLPSTPANNAAIAAAKSYANNPTPENKAALNNALWGMATIRV